MKNKSKQPGIVRTAKEISDELFWRDASHAHDPAGSLKITEQIDKAIREHEGKVRRSPSIANPL